MIDKNLIDKNTIDKNLITNKTGITNKTDITNLLARAETDGANFTLEEIKLLLDCTDPEQINQLRAIADCVRQKEVGDEIWLRGLLEISSYCTCNCLYCGLRGENTKLSRFRMSKEEILAAMEDIEKAGIGTVVMQSGEDPWWTVEKLCDVIQAIKNRYDVAITLSLGDRSKEELAMFKAAGADRYLARHETANSELYARLHPGWTLEKRLQVLEWVKEVGLEVGSGCMVGLPGQTTADLAADIDLARKLDIDMFGIGPFISHPDTPLGHINGGTAEMTYKMLAVSRIVLRNINMPVTTALFTLDEKAREIGWLSGANILMPNATPPNYKKFYELYKNQRSFSETFQEYVASLSGVAKSVGRVIGRGHGGSFKKGGKHHE